MKVEGETVHFRVLCLAAWRGDDAQDEREAVQADGSDRKQKVHRRQRVAGRQKG
jgi:hypothetical protein